MRIHLASTRVRRIRSVYPEISVYAVYPDTCGRSYPYIFVYADVTNQIQSFSARVLLTNALRCPHTNRIRVDGRIRFVYTTC